MWGEKNVIFWGGEKKLFGVWNVLKGSHFAKSTWLNSHLQNRNLFITVIMWQFSPYILPFF